MKKLLCAMALSLAITGCATQSPSENVAASAAHTTAASMHAGSAAVNGVAASGQLASAAAAVPFKAVGAVGKVADKAGNTLLKSASGSGKLEVSNETVTANPPPSAN